VVRLAAAHEEELIRIADDLVAADVPVSAAIENV